MEEGKYLFCTDVLYNEQIPDHTYHVTCYGPSEVEFEDESEYCTSGGILTLACKAMVE